MGRLVDSLNLPVMFMSPDGLGKDRIPVISVDDLELYLRKLPIVYKDFCSPHINEPWTVVDKSATHTGRLLCIEEIKSYPFKEEIKPSNELSEEEKKFVNDMADIARAFNKITDFLKDKL